VRRDHPVRHPGVIRPGKTLVLFGLLLPVLLGMVGLAIDSGLLLATYRQTQNAADTAALSAAMDLLHGKTTGAATTTATTYVQTYNNLAGATVTINVPPASGPHAGNAAYVEALVSYPYNTSFIQLLGVNRNQTVGARAVAGSEAVTSGEGMVTLEQNPQSGKGLTVSGGATLAVNGGIIINSTGKGYDENGNPVNLSNPQGPASSVSNGSAIYAQNVNVSGGVGNGTQPQYMPYPQGSSGPSPLNAGTGVNAPDPLINLPVPTTNSAGNYKVVPTNYGSVSISNGQTQTLNPGIYTDITIGGGTVTFNPGIYVLEGGKTNALDITGGTVTGNGVMFYNTASTYVPSTGADNGTGTTKFGGINISSGGVNFTPLNDVTSPFNGIVIFQDRANTSNISIQGGSSGSQVTGTTYAANALLTITGSGTWNTQFIVGAVSVSGQGTFTVNYAGQRLGKAPEVFLVE
jgi:Flp pilus assembly protein TadG